MDAPTTEHLAAVKHVMRYIAGTLHLGCMYHHSSGAQRIAGFSDNDMAGDVDTRKSTTGLVFILGSSPVVWQSQKQKIVALSSCEAEYVAATTATCQGVWLARLLSEIKDTAAKCIVLKVDNKSSISLAKNLVFHDRSKHIQLRYHFIHECVEDGRVEVEFVSSEHQLPDLLTKPHGRVCLLQLRSSIGMVEVLPVHKH
jgi:hypothetical protein